MTKLRLEIKGSFPAMSTIRFRNNLPVSVRKETTGTEFKRILKNF